LYVSQSRSRWILGDEDRKPPAPECYDDLGIKFDHWILGGDLLRKYRLAKFPPRVPYLKPDPELVETYKDYLSEYERPWIGISWKGGRSNMEPTVLRKQKGTYINIQYGRKEYNGHCWVIETETNAPDWIKSVPVDHNNMEEIFALCAAVDEVNVTQNYIVHVCGSMGKKCNTIKPKPQYGPVGFDESENNRLKWAYGISKNPSWGHPWYSSETVYKDAEHFQNH